MLWIIAGIFTILTIILLSGKGAFLISGYNTASKADKMKYDEKKLCRVTGIGIGIITIFLIVLGCFGKNAPSWIVAALFIVTIAAIIGMAVLGNTICKVKSSGDEMETSDERKRNARTIKWTLIFVTAVLLVIGIVLCTGQIKITVDENNIEIVGSYWEDYQVELNSIKSISYRETLDKGTRTNGMGTFKLLEGNFNNNEFGNYILYAYVKCDNYIILDTTDKIIVINAKTQQETESLYKTLESKVLESK